MYGPLEQENRHFVFVHEWVNAGLGEALNDQFRIQMDVHSMPPQFQGEDATNINFGIMAFFPVKGSVLSFLFY